MFREVLNEYKKFLDSPASKYVLNKSKSGWFGKEASKKINMAEYQCDTKKPYYGFKSWNDFCVLISEKDIHNLEEILNSYSKEKIEFMQEQMKKVWETKNPKKKSTKLTPAKKAAAKARAKAAGRPYPNLIDNMAVARKKK